MNALALDFHRTLAESIFEQMPIPAGRVLENQLGVALPRIGVIKNRFIRLGTVQRFTERVRTSVQPSVRFVITRPSITQKGTLDLDLVDPVEPDRSVEYVITDPETREITTVFLREAKESDAGGIHNLYNSVKVTPGNIHTYNETGGFFNVLSEQEIKRRINTPGGADIVVTDSGGEEILGYCTGRKDLADFSEFTISDSVEADRIAVLGYSSRIGGLLDVVTAPNLPLNGIATLLEYRLMLKLAGGLNQDMIFELYHPKFMIVDGKEIPVNLSNTPSENFHLRMGAKKIGHKDLTIERSDATFLVQADLYVFRNLGTAVRRFNPKVNGILDQET